VIDDISNEEIIAVVMAYTKWPIEFQLVTFSVPENFTNPTGFILTISESPIDVIIAEVLSPPLVPSCAPNLAISGDDYFLSQNLNIVWSTGEFVDKAFSFTVIDDALIEGDEIACMQLKITNGNATVGSKNILKITIKDDDPTGINDIEANAINIFPTLVDETLFIEGIRDTEDLVITIYNVLGEVIMLKQINNIREEIQLDLKSLPSAVYIIRFENDSNMITKKFIKK